MFGSPLKTPCVARAETAASFACDLFPHCRSMAWVSASTRSRLISRSRPLQPLRCLLLCAREGTCLQFKVICVVLVLFMQLGETKAESEKVVRRCAEGVAVRVERLAQALRQAALKQVDSQDSCSTTSLLCSTDLNLRIAIFARKKIVSFYFFQQNVCSPSNLSVSLSLSPFPHCLAFQCVSSRRLRRRLKLWKRKPWGLRTKKLRTRCCVSFRLMDCAHASVVSIWHLLVPPRVSDPLCRRFFFRKGIAVFHIAFH